MAHDFRREPSVSGWPDPGGAACQRTLPTGRQPGSTICRAPSCSVRWRINDLPPLRPVMEYLFEQVRHSHSMVILANGGVLMHAGRCRFSRQGRARGTDVRRLWNEQLRGTNAIGTGTGRASDVEIHGAEHYLERNGFLTCAAAPSLQPTAN